MTAVSGKTVSKEAGEWGRFRFRKGDPGGSRRVGTASIAGHIQCMTKTGRLVFMCGLWSQIPIITTF